MEPQTLSRRERQMMDIVYRLGRATAKQIQEEMADPPSYSAVRATLRILEDKGHLVHGEAGQTYVYRPRVHRQQARLAALDHVRTTFFGGSAEQLMATLLDSSHRRLPDEELDRLAQLIDDARKEGR